VLSATLYAFFGPAPAIKGGGEMVAIGQNLASTGVFGHPFVITMDTGPTAVVPPLFPAYIGILIHFLGGGATWMILAAGVILVQGLHASLLPRLSRTVFGSPEPGFCAAAVCILLPVFSWMPYWDAVYSATGLMLFCLASERLFASGHLFRAAILCPLAGGLLALLNNSSLLVSIPWILLLLHRRQWPAGRVARFCGLAGLVLMLVLLPWALRNYARLGALTLRTNLGMTLYASNNDCASSSMIGELNSGCYMAHHPYGSMAEARVLHDLGEPAYDRNRVAAAAGWIRAHAPAFAALTAQRMAEFWFPNPGYGLTGVSISLVTLFSIPGFVLMKRGIHWRFLVAVAALYPCLYYVVVSDYRYRYPILWLSLLPAGYAISLALDWLRRHAPAGAWISANKDLNI
jgi:hypothetical protein